MRRHTKLTLAAAAVMLAACGDSDEPAPDIAAGTPPAEMSTPTGPDTNGMARAEPPLNASLGPGTYCYFRDDADVTEGLEITVPEDGAITGQNYGTIHQEAEGYYTSFSVTMTAGTSAEDGTLTFDTVTEVDGDTQTGQATWSVTPDSAAPDGLETSLGSAPCDTLEMRVFPPIEE